MKLGNISQTIVQVPNFFVDQKTRTIEAFNLYQKTSKNNSKIKKILKLKLNSMSSKSQNSSVEKNKEKDSSILYKTSRQKKVDSFNRKSNYYRDSDLLTTFYNLNINKNPRNFTRQWIEMNQEKYIPLYYRSNYNKGFKENKRHY